MAQENPEYTHEDSPSPEVVAVYALQNNNTTMMRNLIENREISLAPDENGNSFLHHAAASASPEMIRLLVSMGGDMYQKNELGQTPYDVALTNRNLDAFKGFLESRLDINHQGITGMTVPFEVVALGDWAAVEMFLTEKAFDVNYQDETGYSLLHAAAAYGNLGGIDGLRNMGAVANLQDEVGSTPLHRLMAYPTKENDRVLGVDRLLFMGAEIDAQDNQGKTPLHMAVRFATPKMVKKLIEEGADLTIKDNQGKTPLDYLNEGMALVVEGSDRYHELSEMKEALLGARESDLHVSQTLRGAGQSITDEGQEQDYLRSEWERGY